LFVLVTFAILLLTISVSAKQRIQIDSIIVDKSDGKLYTYCNKRLIKTYDCGIGSNPNGHKVKQGDNRTPEGIYHISVRNVASIFYKNLHIDYPNADDKARAKKLNVKPGGDIKIHGYSDKNGNMQLRNKKFDTTWGCISVTNADMDELFASVVKGAVILIRK
jgi:murein L,D-transpeptidase YafK